MTGEEDEDEGTVKLEESTRVHPHLETIELQILDTGRGREEQAIDTETGYCCYFLHIYTDQTTKRRIVEIEQVD